MFSGTDISWVLVAMCAGLLIEMIGNSMSSGAISKAFGGKESVRSLGRVIVMLSATGVVAGSVACMTVVVINWFLVGF